jgi:hypothetical protein
LPFFAGSRFRHLKKKAAGHAPPLSWFKPDWCEPTR